MIQESQEEQQYDVFYRGTKQQLFAFLYPLTGPDHSIFEHLDMKKLTYETNKRQFQVNFLPKDFENIDKQQQQIVYTSNIVQTKSNYFYSVFQPSDKCFIWQNISNFVEMRPKNVMSASSKQKEKEKESSALIHENKIQLQQVQYLADNNRGRQIIQETNIQPLKQNWDVSRQEYIQYLAQ